MSCPNFMLYHRVTLQVNAKKNAHFMKTADFPDHIKDRLLRIKEQELKRERMHEYEQSLVPVSL